MLQMFVHTYDKLPLKISYGGREMSLFLGKIHYWLFNKITWFENLEEDIISLAKEEGLDIEVINNKIISKLGEKTPNLPLEDIIDTSNIHGWLQERITSAESRVASWITIILEKNSDISKLENLFIKQGKNAAKEVLSKEIKEFNAIDIFNSMNDYILDGMPCDRANEVLSQDENKVVWKRRICVHSEIWESFGGDVEVFYNLRDKWIDSFVSILNKEYKYNFLGNNDFSIEKVGV